MYLAVPVVNWNVADIQAVVVEQDSIGCELQRHSLPVVVACWWSFNREHQLPIVALSGEVNVDHLLACTLVEYDGKLYVIVFRDVEESYGTGAAASLELQKQREVLWKHVAIAYVLRIVESSWHVESSQAVLISDQGISIRDLVPQLGAQ